jgi:(4S)-4-hydroxy-5-phosphonooxypentane-2,3-dione isomerase
MAYVIIVEFRARPDQVEAFTALIDRHAGNSRTEEGCLAFDVCQDPDDPARFVLYEVYRDQAAHARHLEMDSYRWFRATAPDFLVPVSRDSLPHRRQVLTRRPYLSE